MIPASIRYKNPGAMWGNALARKWGAAAKAVALHDGKGQNNNIAVFPTYVQGICAQLDLWRTSKNYKNKRFCDAIAIWSGHNSVEQYISFVLKRVPGMTRNTVMNDEFWRGPMGIAFLKAQAWHEAGKKYPAPDEDWIEAQRRVFGETPTPKPKPLPPPPDVEPEPEPEEDTKPVSKSKTIWASIMAALATAGSTFVDALYDWKTWAAIVVLALLAYIVWERSKRPDLMGFFK